MATAETTTSPFDSVKLLLSLTVLIAGIFAFYHYEEQYIALYRVLALLAVVIFALFIAYQTFVGKTLWAYFQNSRTELRKVVWPTRAETMQTTLIVSIVVVVAGIFLWGLDGLFGWLVEQILAL